MPGRSFVDGRFPLGEPETDLEQRLESHVRTLAGQIGARNVFRLEGLASAAAYIETVLRATGRGVASQPFETWGEPVRNLEVELRGRSRADEIVVVGAHYDSVMGSPGANDNGSGVAAALELARLLAAHELSRTVRVVLFANEEPPFYLTEDMGSLRYARRSRCRGERIVGMLSLETIGCFSEEEGSQRYPFPFGLLYPSRGNFLGFVGNLASWRLVRRTVGSFRRQDLLPAEGLVAPGWATGVGWSDHWSFWTQGYPGAMVTDTALFRDETYHSPRDTPEHLDYARLTRAVVGLEGVVAELAGTPVSP